MDCGYNANPDGLEFDHLPQHTKVRPISDMAGWRWESIMDEVAKCEVVCGTCHAIRTAQRRREESQ